PGEARRSAFRPPRLADGTDGRFELRELEPGTWNLTIRSADSVATRVDGVEVAAGAATEVGVVTLRAGVSLRGRVTDAKGEPIAGANVHAILLAAPGDWGSMRPRDDGAY